MAKIGNLIKGLQIFEKYFEQNSDVYDVQSFEDETVIAVSCKVSDEDSIKLIEIGWENTVDEDDDTVYDEIMWLY
jgi:hypothetical protein